MSKDDHSRILGEWESYRIGSCQRFEAGRNGPRPEVWIELLAEPVGEMECSGCGARTDRLHDVAERWVRDLPILGAQTYLLVWRRRVHCPRCGPKLEALAWLEPYDRITRRLAESVGRMCKILPIKHVAEYYGLDRKTVKRLDKRYLERTLGPVDLSGVEQIVMDEFAIQKGHRYATVVVEARSKRVLWVGRGRGREDVRPFFEALGPAGCERIEAAAMDMHAAYEEEVRSHCPKAQIVYDLFHVVAKYGREVVDRVRVDEANRLRDDKPARKVVKGSRWLLLRNRHNIRRKKDRVRLSELLKANRALATVYVLKEDLKHLWDYKSPSAARRFWQGWYDRAMRSGIEPLKKFARNLSGRIEGVLSHCRYPLHTSLLEGINNKIKVIKRMAYGFRDDAYFFMKIRAAFPGNGP